MYEPIWLQPHEHHTNHTLTAYYVHQTLGSDRSASMTHQGKEQRDDLVGYRHQLTDSSQLGNITIMRRLDRKN